MKKIYQTDPWLEPFKGAIDARSKRLEAEIANIQGKAPRLADAVNNHLYYGLHKTGCCANGPPMLPASGS